jgi:hypothetical protein
MTLYEDKHAYQYCQVLLLMVGLQCCQWGNTEGNHSELGHACVWE